MSLLAAAAVAAAATAAAAVGYDWFFRKKNEAYDRFGIFFSSLVFFGLGDTGRGGNKGRGERMLEGEGQGGEGEEKKE